MDSLSADDRKARFLVRLTKLIGEVLETEDEDFVIAHLEISKHMLIAGIADNAKKYWAEMDQQQEH